MNGNLNDGAERTRQINENVANVLLHGQKVVVSGEVEYLHIPNQELKPIKCVPEYDVEVNDLLCGNKPFKQHVMS